MYDAGYANIGFIKPFNVVLLVQFYLILFDIVYVDGLTIIGRYSNLYLNNSYQTSVVVTDIIIYYFMNNLSRTPSTNTEIKTQNPQENYSQRKEEKLNMTTYPYHKL